MRAKLMKSKLSFMSLPPEVRNIIYRCLFVRSYPIRPVSQELRMHRMGKGGQKMKKWRKEEEIRAAPMSTSINFLQTSKQIALEGASFVYGAPNEFLLYTDGHHPEAMYNWLVEIRQRNRESIRTLSIDWSNGVNSTCRNRKALNDVTGGWFREMEKTRMNINHEARLAKRQLVLQLKKMQNWTVSMIRITLTTTRDYLQLRSLSLSMPVWDDALTTLAGKNYGDLWRDENFIPDTENIPNILTTLSDIEKLTIGPVSHLRPALQLAIRMGLQRVEVFGTTYVSVWDIEDGWVKLPKGADIEERWVIEFVGSEDLLETP